MANQIDIQELIEDMQAHIRYEASIGQADRCEVCQGNYELADFSPQEIALGMNKADCENCWFSTECENFSERYRTLKISDYRAIASWLDVAFSGYFLEFEPEDYGFDPDNDAPLDEYLTDDQLNQLNEGMEAFCKQFDTKE